MSSRRLVPNRMTREEGKGATVVDTPRGRWLVRAVVAPGALTGLIAVVSFGAVHAVLIVPIWRRLPGGVPFGLVGGIAMAWAFEEFRASGKFSRGYRGGLLFGAFIWFTLFPMTGLAAWFRSAGIRSTLGEWEVVIEVGVAFLSGALGALALRPGRRAVVASGTATLALALVMGGPLAILAQRRAAWLFEAFLAIYLFAGLILVAANRLFRNSYLSQRPAEFRNESAPR
jgi:hypothetical protein